MLQRLSRRPWSLAARLTTWSVCSSFAVLLLATACLYWALANTLERADARFLADEADALRTLLHDSPANAAALRWEVEDEWTAGPQLAVLVRILDEKGRVLSETPSMSDELPASAFPPAGADDGRSPQDFDVRSKSGATFRALAVNATAGPERASRVIQIALDQTRNQDLLAEYRARLWLVLAVALPACAIVGHRIAQRGVRPIKTMTDAAREVRSTTLHERITVAGLPAELLMLAETFNDVLDRLEDSFARISQFSADIAHELRTPLSNLRSGAEVTLAKARVPEEYREALGLCLEECGRMSHMIDTLLFLASADSPEARIRREPVDVSGELGLVREFYEPAAGEVGVALKVEAPTGINADIDRVLFQRAVGNLLANALSNTARGGTVTLRAAKLDGALHVEVIDTGRGIPAVHLARVFDRFYRVDQARSRGSGSLGLGLAIVKSIVALHGGSTHIASEVGRGTRLTLVFPG